MQNRTRSRAPSCALWRILMVALALWAGATRGVASEVAETAEFAEVGATVLDYEHKIAPEKILLVLDLDNTLLTMNSHLGSDQWYEWQMYLLEHEPKSKQLVADSKSGVLEAQGLLYSISHMHPPQENLPGLMRRLQQTGIRTVVLTSRGPDFRAATERELKRNGYDFAKTAMPAHNLPHGNFMPYDPKHPENDGLREDELKKFHLKEPRPISYENGIMMTAGQHKGAMLLTLLHDSGEDVEAIVYDDDNLRHVAHVYAAALERKKEITAFHYTREDANVKKFEYGNKEDVTRRWRKLSEALEEVLQ